MNNSEVAVLETGYSNDILTFKKLGEAMREGIDPPPQLLPDLLYEQGIHSIYAPGGTGKTIVALWCAVQAMKQGLEVIYCDEENGFNAIAERLQSYGADPELVDTHIHYAEFPHLTSEETERWERTVRSVQPSLVVFDSFADMLALEGYDENSSVHVTQWMKNFAEPVKQLGGAVLILDHINKAKSGKGARGSTAKLAKVDVAWQLEGKAFDRHTAAELTIKKDKDRIGCLPKQQKFIVGGDGEGNLIFNTGDISNATDPSDLRGHHKVAFDVLLSNFPHGATSGEWKQASIKDKRMSERNFYRVKNDLVGPLVDHEEEKGLYVVNV